MQCPKDELLRDLACLSLQRDLCASIPRSPASVRSFPKCITVRFNIAFSLGSCVLLFNLLGEIASQEA